MTLVPPHVPDHWITELDVQLSSLGSRAIHVLPGPRLAAISWASVSIVSLEHQPLDSYLQAEQIATRVNRLRGVCDAERSAIMEYLK